RTSFVWILGTGSSWEDNELRYSIRSVEKHHQDDAEVLVIGSKPSWYRGPHLPYLDTHTCPYINQWEKLRIACQIPDISDPFVYMDDDFYLMQPLDRFHFRGPYNLQGRVDRVRGSEHWKEACKNTLLHGNPD